MTEAKVKLAASLCEGRCVYTNLSLEHGLELPSGKCPLSQVEFDEKSYRWSEASRPGGYRHIVLKESAACVWSLHDRIRRPAEMMTKCLQLLDSASLVGALKKGRSASGRLNAVCRQVKACLLGYDMEAFWPWVASERIRAARFISLWLARGAWRTSGA